MSAVGKYTKKIKSAKNIAKITYAMQLVAASKMKRAQASALSGKEYALSLNDLTHVLSKYLNRFLHPLIGEPVLKSNSKKLFLLIAPEKGLCGALVTNIARFVMQVVKEEGGKEKCEFVVIGARATLIAKRLALSIVAEFKTGLSSPKFDIVPPIARFVQQRFTDGLSSNVSIIFAEFITTMIQTPQRRDLLPLVISSEEPESTGIRKDYLFEPTPEDIVNSLLEMYLEVEIYQLLLDAFASEQSARMIAMKNATDNAKGLIEELTIEYNKLRQAGITNEILDIGNQRFIET